MSMNLLSMDEKLSPGELYFRSTSSHDNVTKNEVNVVKSTRNSVFGYMYLRNL